MTTQTEALKLALEALKSSNKLINGTDTKFGLAGAIDGYYNGCFDVEGNNKLINRAIASIEAINSIKGVKHDNTNRSIEVGA